ncbi:MAG: hypothetical protein AAF570_24655, partial [Bacteroidota bacterium]
MIRGIYRWVDKIYEAQMYNYGQRLMFEFIVPEPAAQYAHKMKRSTNADSGAPRPEPLPEDFSYHHIDEMTFQGLVHEYNVQGVDLPPDEIKVLAKAFSEKQVEAGKFGQTASSEHEIAVPEGYVCKSARVSVSISYPSHVTGFEPNPENLRILDPLTKLSINVGNLIFKFATTGTEKKELIELPGTIPISLTGEFLSAYAASVQVECTLTEKGRDAWRMATYDKIMAAYNQQMAAYEESQIAAEFRREQSLEGRHASFNAQIVLEELQRGCLTLLTTNDFAANGAIVAPNGPTTHPEINQTRAHSKRSYIQFMEQAFEWNELTYQFYAYFWGRKHKWHELSMRESVDPNFRDFLRAGAGRVLVPVTPGYEKAVMHYLETGVLWEGGDAPVLDDPLYRSIALELMR